MADEGKHVHPQNHVDGCDGASLAKVRLVVLRDVLGGERVQRRYGRSRGRRFDVGRLRGEGRGLTLLPQVAFARLAFSLGARP